MTSTGEIAYIIRRENELIYEKRPQDLKEEDWDFLRVQGIINGCGAKTGPFASFRPPCIVGNTGGVLSIAQNPKNIIFISID